MNNFYGWGMPFQQGLFNWASAWGFSWQQNSYAPPVCTPCCANNTYQPSPKPVYEDKVLYNPVYEEKIYHDPVYEDKVYKDPVYEDKVYKDPVYEDKVYKDPVYEDKVYKDPVYEDKVYKDPIYEDKVYKDPVYKEVVEKQPKVTTSSGKMWDVQFDYKNGQETQQKSPIVLDLNENGKADITGKNLLGDGQVSGDPVLFDIDPTKKSWEFKSRSRRPGNGAPEGGELGSDGFYYWGKQEPREKTEWLAKNGGDGLLVWDVDQDGKITSSKELFGNYDTDGTEKFKDGYEKLALHFDKNKDGQVSGDELKGLQIWKDANADGITDPGELEALNKYNITSLDVKNIAPNDKSSTFTKETTTYEEVKRQVLTGYNERVEKELVGYKDRVEKELVGYKDRVEKELVGYKERHEQELVGYKERHEQELVGYKERHEQEIIGYKERVEQQLVGYEKRHEQVFLGYEYPNKLESVSYEKGAYATLSSGNSSALLQQQYEIYRILNALIC